MCLYASCTHAKHGKEHFLSSSLLARLSSLERWSLTAGVHPDRTGSVRGPLVDGPSDRILKESQLPHWSAARPAPLCGRPPSVVLGTQNQGLHRSPTSLRRPWISFIATVCLLTKSAAFFVDFLRSIPEQRLAPTRSTAPLPVQMRKWQHRALLYTLTRIRSETKQNKHDAAVSFASALHV